MIFQVVIAASAVTRYEACGWPFRISRSWSNNFPLGGWGRIPLPQKWVFSATKQRGPDLFGVSSIRSLLGIWNHMKRKSPNISKLVGLETRGFLIFKRWKWWCFQHPITGREAWEHLWTIGHRSFGAQMWLLGRPVAAQGKGKIFQQVAGMWFFLQNFEIHHDTPSSWIPRDLRFFLTAQYAFLEWNVQLVERINLASDSRNRICRFVILEAQQLMIQMDDKSKAKSKCAAS